MGVGGACLVCTCPEEADDLAGLLVVVGGVQPVWLWLWVEGQQVGGKSGGG
jgi:hypothetical protein